MMKAIRYFAAACLLAATAAAQAYYPYNAVGDLAAQGEADYWRFQKRVNQIKATWYYLAYACNEQAGYCSVSKRPFYRGEKTEARKSAQANCLEGAGSPCTVTGAQKNGVLTIIMGQKDGKYQFFITSKYAQSGDTERINNITNDMLEKCRRKGAQNCEALFKAWWGNE